MKNLLTGNSEVKKVNILTVKSGEVEEGLTKREKMVVWLTVLDITLVFGGMRMMEQSLVKEIEIIKKRKQESLADLATRFRIITPDEYETFKSNFESKTDSPEADTKREEICSLHAC